MQEKIIYVKDDMVSSVNAELSAGWRVNSVNPVYAGSYHCGAYVHLVKDK